MSKDDLNQTKSGFGALVSRTNFLHPKFLAIVLILLMMSFRTVIAFVLRDAKALLVLQLLITEKKSISGFRFVDRVGRQGSVMNFLSV